MPKELKPLLGNYWLAPVQAEFKVFYEDGVLKMYDPLAKMAIKFQDQNEGGFWIDEFNKFKIEFVKNDTGKIIRMLMYKNVLLTKLKD